MDDHDILMGDAEDGISNGVDEDLQERWGGEG